MTELHCNTSLRNWLKSIEDPKFFSDFQYNENNQPFKSENLEIEIVVPFLIDRFSENIMTVQIQSSDGDVLFEGKIYNGKLKEKVSTNLAIHPGWRSQLWIFITEKELSDNDIGILAHYK